MKTHTLTRKINFDYRKGRHDYTRLIVHHFNGEPWPFKPLAISVDIIG